MGPYIVNVFKHNQQDVTLHSGIYYYKHSACFRRFLRPSSGAQNCIHNIGYRQAFPASYRYRGWVGTPRNVASCWLCLNMWIYRCRITVVVWTADCSFPSGGRDCMPGQLRCLHWFIQMHCEYGFRYDGHFNSEKQAEWAGSVLTAILMSGRFGLCLPVATWQTLDTESEKCVTLLVH